MHATPCGLVGICTTGVMFYTVGSVALQAACGGPNAPLSFEGAAWNSSTVAVIAAAKAHTEMVLLQVRSKVFAIIASQPAGTRVCWAQRASGYTFV